MFVTAGEVEAVGVLEGDLLIIGTGPAGLLVASELMGRGLRIIMLESGKFEFNREIQLLNQAEIVGAPNHPGTFSRYRIYGGSTTRWTGQSVPMEAIDFEARSGIPDSGWPISLDDLQPWYDKAADSLGLPATRFAVAGWEQRLGKLPPIANDELKAATIAYAKPIDLGAALRERLEKADDVTIVLDANVHEIETSTDGSTATAAVYKTYGGTEGRATGRKIILACGGIENARLLLASRGISEAGIGNQNDVVGRYFMDHPYLMPGWFAPSDPETDRGWHVIEDFVDLAESPGINAVFTLDPDLRRKEELTACVGYFVRREAWQLTRSYYGRGGSALTYFAETARGERVRAGDDAEKFRDLVFGAPSTLETLRGWAMSAFRPKPRAALRICLEATPNRDSRVTLSAQRDALGQPLARVDWRMHDRDWRGLDRFRKALAQSIQSVGLGHLAYDDAVDAEGYPVTMTGGRHHMGATRMHTDPKRGVVDSNLRVHGMENLYVAGSSVFPTGGWANPTFTIAALSLRLADHLGGME